MIVKINWGTGGMSVDAEGILYSMTLRDFKKWCKLLAQFGEEDAKRDMLAACQKEIQFQQDEKRNMESCIRDFQGKLDGSIPTQLAPKYLREQIRLLAKHYNGTARKLSNLEKKYACLKEVVSNGV